MSVLIHLTSLFFRPSLRQPLHQTQPATRKLQALQNQTHWQPCGGKMLRSTSTQTPKTPVIQTLGWRPRTPTPQRTACRGWSGQGRAGDAGEAGLWATRPLARVPAPAPSAAAAAAASAMAAPQALAWTERETGQAHCWTDGTAVARIVLEEPRRGPSVAKPPAERRETPAGMLWPRCCWETPVNAEEHGLAGKDQNLPLHQPARKSLPWWQGEGLISPDHPQWRSGHLNQAPMPSNPAPTASTRLCLKSSTRRLPRTSSPYTPASSLLSLLGWPIAIACSPHRMMLVCWPSMQAPATPAARTTLWVPMIATILVMIPGDVREMPCNWDDILESDDSDGSCWSL